MLSSPVKVILKENKIQQVLISSKTPEDNGEPLEEDGEDEEEGLEQQGDETDVQGCPGYFIQMLQNDIVRLERRIGVLLEWIALLP